MDQRSSRCEIPKLLTANKISKDKLQIEKTDLTVEGGEKQKKVFYYCCCVIHCYYICEVEIMCCVI